MRRRPMPPDVPVFIGASLVAYGAGAASRRSSRSSRHFTIFLATYQPAPLQTFRLANSQRCPCGRLQSRQIGFDAVQYRGRFASDDHRVGQLRTFLRVADEPWFHQH